MTFNIEKCTVMHIDSRNLPSACYYMNGHKLEECQEEKDLGVLVSKSLKVGPPVQSGFSEGKPDVGTLEEND